MHIAGGVDDRGAGKLLGNPPPERAAGSVGQVEVDDEEAY
jgi:hypothetical protein